MDNAGYDIDGMISETVPLETIETPIETIETSIDTGESSQQQRFDQTEQRLAQQRLELLRGKINDLYTHLGVEKRDLDDLQLQNFRLRSIKTGANVLEFNKNGEDWINLTNKINGEWLAYDTLKGNLGGKSGMKTV